MVIGEANAAMRVHDRMPAILGTEAARRWLEPGPLPAELLVPYPAEAMTAWRVGDDAKSSRIEPHPGMAEPVPIAWRASLTYTLRHVEPAVGGAAMNKARSPSPAYITELDRMIGRAEGACERYRQATTRPGLSPPVLRRKDPQPEKDGGHLGPAAGAERRASPIGCWRWCLAARVACGHEQAQHEAEDRGGDRRQHDRLRRERQAAVPPELVDANLHPSNDLHNFALLHLRFVINRCGSEPRRVCRRLNLLSHAAMAGVSIC